MFYKKTEKEKIQYNIEFWRKDVKHWLQAYRKYRGFVPKLMLLQGIRQLRYWRNELKKKVKTC